MTRIEMERRPESRSGSTFADIDRLEAASTVRSCGKAAKSLHGGYGMRGRKSQRAAKGKSQSCRWHNSRSGSQSAVYDGCRTACTNDLRGIA